MPSRWRATRSTRRSSPIAPAKPKTPPLPIWRSARRPGKSRPARRAEPTASANTTSCFASKRNSGHRRVTPADRLSRLSRAVSDAMHTVVLLRHGFSTWNQENRFTGWTDVDLAEQGNKEAAEAGRLLKEGGYVFDVAYT